MYRKFYGLTRNPFELSPDPSFFYSTDRHNEALAVLAHGVLGRKGFVVVTGEVGTGKTLLVRCLLDALTSNQVAFAYVYNPMLSVPDFLAHVLSDLGLPSVPRTKGETLFHLNNYLLAALATRCHNSAHRGRGSIAQLGAARRNSSANESGDFPAQTAPDRLGGTAGAGQ